MEYQWFPGHMTKAFRMMQEDIKLIDLVIELLDARVPISSKNPDIDKLAKGKSRLIVLNKYDLANESESRYFETMYEERGFTVVKSDCRNRGNVKKISDAVEIANREKTEKNRKKGIINRPVRAMVVGIPNVGKSTLINSLSNKASAKTGNKPGVTRGKQWIRLNKQIELLDTPGVLWPKFEDKETGLRLALIGTINDDIIDHVELAMSLIGICLESYSDAFIKRYGLEPREILESQNTGNPSLNILEMIAKKRGALLKGGDYDLLKAARLLLSDFRSGKLGRITLDGRPDNG
ncbi:MAG: ribosome biogenesis GTPase YlqF [Lachnospiraceae bacterium]|nr:ribosome biogenesis GTPase YlqF [Lachnospiraceae bacterium]